MYCLLKNVCNAIFKCLHSKGIGTETKVTPALSISEEDILRDKGIINLDNPVGLMNAVFSYNGKHFCLRGGAEHCNLKLSQVKRETSTIDSKEIPCYIMVDLDQKTTKEA